MRRKLSIISVSLLVITILLVACQGADGGEPQTESAQQISGQATVETVEALILEGFPYEVQAYVRGTLGDSCTVLDSVSMSRSGNQFTGVISTTRPADAVCTQALIPFERLIPLDVAGLSAGEYSVSINGIETSFDLAQDNIAPTPTPVDSASGRISGRLWHDLCGTAGGDPDNPEVITEDCVEMESGGFLADGRRRSGEPPIAGIEVSLGAGSCPQAAVITSETDEDGRYSFSGLKAGTYCVFIEPLVGKNRELLIPGAWTAPALDQGYHELELEVADQVQAIDFGWDYEILPPVNFEGCQNQAQFVEDVTVPDDTVFAPREVFTKTWRLRNTGTCHWVGGYSLDFAAGDQMGGTAVELGEVLSGQDSIVSVRLQAPETEGPYRGDWQLLDPEGERFGTVGDFDLTFFVKIVVQEPEVTTPAIRGIIWDDACTVLAGATPGEGCDTDTEGNFIANGIFDETEEPLAGVEVTIFRGTCPPRGNPFESVTSTETGDYIFEGLDPGLYCVVVDQNSPINQPLLEAGRWTQPAIDVSSINVEVDEDEIKADIDFGWDFESE